MRLFCRHVVTIYDSISAFIRNSKIQPRKCLLKNWGKLLQDPFISMDHVNGLLIQDILTFAFTRHDRPVPSGCK